jgi:hypothetical protein
MWPRPFVPADLNYHPFLPNLSGRNFKSKATLESYTCRRLFDSEAHIGAAASVADLKFLAFFAAPSERNFKSKATLESYTC